MPITLLSLFLLFTGLLFRSEDLFQSENSYKVHDLRHFMESSAKDKEVCERFVKHLGNYKGKDPVVLGFEAAAQGVMAKHAWSPYYKLKYLHHSAQLFEKVMKQHPQVPEVHFLRYTVQFFIPRYLNLSDNLEEDKKVFLPSLLAYPKSELDAEAVQIMRRFLLRHPEHLTEQELKLITNLKV
ncbi:MAG: hypothetical protein ACO1O1_10440 [Adhaeribacter sp.]